jgi:tetraacyldisaccharide 4'-kinase
MREAPRARVDPPVFCVGNPTVGGAGKTPVAIAIARVLRAAGARPVFLTRGHGGREAGPIVVKGQGADIVGDEALLLAEVAPTVVARDRAAGGRLAASFGDAIVMDDGFQNPALAKTWSCLVVDAAAGLGNRRVTPAGPLRAPLAAHLPLADALLVVAGDEAVRAPLTGTDGLRRFEVSVSARSPVPLDGRRVLAFAGIGRPAKFFATVRRLGGELVVERAFADHHPYSEREARRLRAAAAAGGLIVVTTAKDRVRLKAGGPEARALGQDAIVIEVRAELPAALEERIRAVYAHCGPPAKTGAAP